MEIVVAYKEKNKVPGKLDVFNYETSYSERANFNCYSLKFIIYEKSWSLSLVENFKYENRVLFSLFTHKINSASSEQAIRRDINKWLSENIIWITVNGNIFYENQDQ